MSKFKLKLDTYKRNIRNPTITIRQGDSNQQIECSLTDNLSASDITNSEITFYATTPNGAKVIDSNVIKTDVTQGVFVYNLPSSLGQNVGQCKNAYFEIKVDKAILTTQAIDINVIAGVDLTADEASNYVTTAGKALDDAKNEIAQKFEKVATNLDGFDSHLTAATNGLADKANMLSGQLDDKAKQLTSDLDGNIKSVGEAQHAVSADHANTAGHADSATNADTAKQADSATNAKRADSATTADKANVAGRADTATSADQAGHASTADKATAADTAKRADSASSADNATHAASADSATNSVHADTATNADSAKFADKATTAGIATHLTRSIEVTIKTDFGFSLNLKRVGDSVFCTSDGYTNGMYSWARLGAIIPVGFRPEKLPYMFVSSDGDWGMIGFNLDGSTFNGVKSVNSGTVRASGLWTTADDMP